MMPPWLWLWLTGDLAVLIPAEVSNDFSALMAATAGGLRHPPPGAARGVTSRP